VHIRRGAIPDVIDEGHLGPYVLLVAGRAVEKDADRLRSIEWCCFRVGGKDSKKARDCYDQIHQ